MTAATAAFAEVAPRRPIYLRIVRASGLYDLVVTAGFATPWTLGFVHSGLDRLGAALGVAAFPELDPMQILYANLMGSVVVIWSLLRVIGPVRIHGLLDGFARLLFSTWMAYALLRGGPDVLWLFLFIEIVWGVVQLAPWLHPDFRRGAA